MTRPPASESERITPALRGALDVLTNYLLRHGTVRQGIRDLAEMVREKLKLPQRGDSRPEN